jgi:two-component system phosphate regulon sensor histidine kinase PhoR
MLVRDISQLHRLEMMRKDFVGNVSHELRTPITVITGYLETMQDDRQNIPSRWSRPIEQMYQQSQRMENIIRDLLTLSQLETRSASKQLSAVQLQSLLREIKQDAEQVSQDKNQSFRLECDPDIYIRGNINELYSAISNLAINAAKYTQAGGTIELSASNSAEGLKISVSDNGPGIEAHHIPRLTERFYRVDESRSTDTGGTGLGLAIVKHVLARHGGRLEIRSKVGQGSQFSCLLPADRVLTAAQAAERPRAEQS